MKATIATIKLMIANNIKIPITRAIGPHSGAVTHPQLQETILDIFNAKSTKKTRKQVLDKCDPLSIVSLHESNSLRFCSQLSLKLKIYHSVQNLLEERTWLEA